MSTHFENRINRRRHARFTLPPMYTPVTVRRVLKSRGLAIQVLEGHAYDISESGVRLEVDELLEVGELVRLTVNLPLSGSVSMWAQVVRIHEDEDDPRATRIAVQVREFATPADHARLVAHLGEGHLRRAA